jgi:ketosteroid isomerase-like protein
MSCLRRLNQCVLAAALAAGSAITSPAFADDAGAQIGELDQKWVEALKKGDLDWVEAIYLSDGLLLPPNAPPVEGPSAIVEIWKSYVGLPNVAIDFGPNRVEASSSGDLAYDYGWYTFGFDSDKGRVEDKGKYVVVWKNVDGKWKVAADIFNSNLATE